MYQYEFSHSGFDSHLSDKIKSSNTKEDMNKYIIGGLVTYTLGFLFGGGFGFWLADYRPDPMPLVENYRAEYTTLLGQKDIGIMLLNGAGNENPDYILTKCKIFEY